MLKNCDRSTKLSNLINYESQFALQDINHLEDMLKTMKSEQESRREHLRSAIEGLARQLEKANEAAKLGGVDEDKLLSASLIPPRLFDRYCRIFGALCFLRPTVPCHPALFFSASPQLALLEAFTQQQARSCSFFQQHSRDSETAKMKVTILNSFKNSS